MSFSGGDGSGGGHIFKVTRAGGIATGGRSGDYLKPLPLRLLPVPDDRGPERPLDRIRSSMRHVISILLQNESGALARVASMFASRGFNIESLNVAPTDDETVSRLTMVTVGTEAVISQMSKQLAKLIDVVAIADRTATDHIERELGLLKFTVEPRALAAFEAYARGRSGEILDRDPAHFTLQVTGTEKEVDGFLDGIPDGVRILSIVRSGPLAISRGPHALV